MEQANGASISPSESAPPFSIPKCCPVCMRKLKKCELGKPATCNHVFCFTCLYEWSKNVNTCPVDRVKFNIIEVFGTEGECSRQVAVEDHSLEQVLVDPFGLTYCEVCGQCTREDRLLLCDGCDKGYHTSCLVPKLKKVPAGNWYCKHCEPIVRGVLVSSDTVNDSSSESDQEDIVVLEDKQLEVPKPSLVLDFKEADSKEAISSFAEDIKDPEKLSSGSSESRISSMSTSSNDSDVDFMTSRGHHSKSFLGADKQHIVLKRGGYLVNKRKRRRKRVNLERQDRPIGNQIKEFDFLSSGSSSRGARVPSSPRSKGRARTVATGGQTPSVSIRQAVIASHRCSSSQDGLVAAQRIAQGVWQAPGASAMSTVRQKRPNAHQRSQNLTVPMRYCSVTVDKLPLNKSSRNNSPSLSNVLRSSPTHNRPVDLTVSPPKRPIAEKLDFSRPSTTDYVGEICQNLDNLQAKDHIFHRDGSIEAVQSKIRMPMKTRKKVALEMARYSQENEASRSQYIRARSENTSSRGQPSNSQSSTIFRSNDDSSDSQAPPQNSQAASSCSLDAQASRFLSQTPDSPKNASALGSCCLAPATSQDTQIHSKNFKAPTSDNHDSSLHVLQAPKFQQQNSGSHESLVDSQSIAMKSTAEKVSVQIKKLNPRARRRRRRRRELKIDSQGSQIGSQELFNPQLIWQQEQSMPFTSRHRKYSQPQTQLSKRTLSRQPKDRFPSLTPATLNTNPQLYQTPLSTLPDKKAIPCVPLFPELSSRVRIKQEPQPISPVQTQFNDRENYLNQLRSSNFFDSPSRPQPLFSHFYSDQCEDKQFLQQSMIKSEPSEINFTTFQSQMVIKSEPPTDVEPCFEHRYMCEAPSSDFHYPEPSENQYLELDSAYQYDEQSHYSCDLSPSHYEDPTSEHYPATDCDNSLHALFPRSCHSPQQSMDCSDWPEAAAEQMEVNCPKIMRDTAYSPSDMCLSSPNHFYKSFWQYSSDSPIVEPAAQSVAVDQMNDSGTEHYRKWKIESLFRSLFHEQKDTTSSDDSMYTPVYPVEPMNWSSPVPASMHETSRSRSKKTGTLLNCQLAGEYVVQLLDQYRQKGFIPKEHVHRITEKALRKVQKTKNLVPEARVKKLVDDYIAIYRATACLT